jgi:hypothetical protein
VAALTIKHKDTRWHCKIKDKKRGTKIPRNQHSSQRYTLQKYNKL